MSKKTKDITSTQVMEAAKETSMRFPSYTTPKRVLFTLNSMLSVHKSRTERCSRRREVERGIHTLSKI